MIGKYIYGKTLPWSTFAHLINRSSRLVDKSNRLSGSFHSVSAKALAWQPVKSDATTLNGKLRPEMDKIWYEHWITNACLTIANPLRFWRQFVVSNCTIECMRIYNWMTENRIYFLSMDWFHEKLICILAEKCAHIVKCMEFYCIFTDCGDTIRAFNWRQSSNNMHCNCYFPSYHKFINNNVE